MNRDILDILNEKGNKGAEEVALIVREKNLLINELFRSVTGPNKRVKNASIKTLAIISRDKPTILYPYYKFFVNLIDNDDKILKWNAIDIIGNLSYIDSKNKLDTKLIKKYFNLLSNEVMITAAHSVDNLWKFALNKPRFHKKITTELLKIDTIKRNLECNNIIIDKTILAFKKYFHLVEDKDSVFSFVKRHLNNKRGGTRKKAEEFLKKFNP